MIFVILVISLILKDVVLEQQSILNDIAKTQQAQVQLIRTLRKSKGIKAIQDDVAGSKTVWQEQGPPYSGPARCHQLKGNRAETFSVDLEHPYRLLFCPNHNPIPVREEGGFDWSQITAIEIIGVEDTHD